MQTKRWLIAPPLTSEADHNLKAFPPILRQILYNRGYATDTEARDFLRAQPGTDTDPYRLSGMEASITRIREAISQQESIVIFGDYDVDGVTATTLLVQALKSAGAQVRGYIPNRFDEGYGLNTEALDSLANEGVRLVITVDCGIRSPEEAAHAKKAGLDLIISDHHHPSEKLPEAFAIINPKQAGDKYPYKDLAGVGIAYKITQALFTETPEKITEFLDLVALGTVADLAPLTGENRYLVRQGLRLMKQTRRQGLHSLAGVSNLNLKNINATGIGFILGPRLNAAGRLDSALAAYDLLTTEDFMQAGQLAQQLELQNRQRQSLTRQIQEQAEKLAISDHEKPHLLVAIDSDFNTGVVGLAASRLTENHYRPSIVGQIGEKTTRCSCRSIPEFHITDALDRCADLLIQHGGHAAAAGFTVSNENLEELVTRMKAFAVEELEGKDLRPTVSADVEVLLKDLDYSLLKTLSYLEPTGYGNPEAVFASRGLKIQNARTVGTDSKHLKLTLTDGQVTFDAIAFRFGYLADETPVHVDVMYTFEVNEYNGHASLQLNIRDIKPANVSD
ncbi:MAG: single-stranded-DNA-specific exonuclease RecJ [Anaerolineales bacterium]|nr:single-stranded-DNA-specific exonuclease RecJ [Anaerolineales bacterium]